MATWPEFRPGALLERLASHGVDFVVIGGVAMVGHGSARITRDLDICYATDPVNLEALGAAMVALGAWLRGVPDDVAFVPDAQTLRQTSILTLDSPDGWINVIVSPSGAPAYEQLRSRAERIMIDRVAILVASLDDLEAMKRGANRDKDRLDLEEIEAIRRLRARGVGPPPG